MDRNQSSDYRRIGADLARFVRQQGGQLPSAAALQGVVADLVAGQEDLLLPLRDLVNRPTFRALAGLAGSGSGVLQRDALLQELSRTFAPALLTALRETLNGFLNLPAESGFPSAAQAPPPRSQTSYESVAKPAFAPPSEPDLGPAQDSSVRQFPARPRSSAAGFAGLVVATAFFMGAAVWVTQNPILCKPLGVCLLGSGVSPSDQALKAGGEAEQALRRATTLEGYQSALEGLQRELLKLSGDALSAEQQRQRDRLVSSSTAAKQTLAAEQADLEQLTRATDAVAQVRDSAGEARLEQIAMARQALDAIPPRSFSSSEASRLRQKLDVVVLQASAEPQTDSNARETPEITGSAPAASVPAWSPPSPPAAPSARPWKPATPAPRPATGSTAPARDQPLF